MPYGLEDALMSGPGHDGYIYQGDVYCIDCGKAIIEEVFRRRRYKPMGWTEFRDSEILPQPIFFGESDSPQHCAQCGEYLYGGEAEE